MNALDHKRYNSLPFCCLLKIISVITVRVLKILGSNQYVSWINYKEIHWQTKEKLR